MLQYQFKADLNQYLAGRPDPPVHSLEELIAYNTAHAGEEMPYFEQELLIALQGEGRYRSSVPRCPGPNLKISRQEGIDEIIDCLSWMPSSHQLAVRPGSSTSSTVVAAPSRAPRQRLSRIPADHRSSRLRLWRITRGCDLHGEATEPTHAIKIAFAFEHAMRAWRPPEFLPTLRLA